MTQHEELFSKKKKILDEIEDLNDFRSGTLSSCYRKCGKDYCHCAKDGSKGHGPLWRVTRSVEGKTLTKGIPLGKVEETSSQIETYHEFQDLIHEYIETNIKICDLKLNENKRASGEAKKKGSTRNSKRR